MKQTVNETVKKNGEWNGEKNGEWNGGKKRWMNRWKKRWMKRWNRTVDESVKVPVDWNGGKSAKNKKEKIIREFYLNIEKQSLAEWEMDLGTNFWKYSAF